MPFFINITNLNSNGVNQNGNFNVGAVVHNSHTSNNKFVGLNSSFGNISPSLSNHVNGNVDPDVIDQGQVSNPSSPVANQF